MERTSKVDQIQIISLDDTSILEIGDSECLNPLTKAISVQREQAVFWKHEFNFEDYPIFARDIPVRSADEEMERETYHLNPLIQVGKVEVPFVASSSIIHIGSSRELHAEARVVTIRHLIREGNMTEEEV
ncbi:spore germination protein GerPE [Ammoniphilus resinae]|uniref:Spore germination protein PE n=1 Tax=Ammoniphilus resinae TaxID=861532 RepID=A0ABS4GQ86_9BACL|nr:spore germination protein GerPE [Ammoniphilus resinae]MBP1932406.1 spore germination protein PE [Ammoniphilus resinae]